MFRLRRRHARHFIEEVSSVRPPACMLVPVAVGLAAPKREGVEVAGLAPNREEVLVLPNKDVPATQNVKSCLQSMEVF